VKNLINQDHLNNVQTLQQQFKAASPFKYLVIDQFFNNNFCQSLVSDFPTFDKKRALNENGEVGMKATHEQITKIGTAYKQLDSMVKSDEFLGFVSDLTGIPELRFDPFYFGGGTHENLHGQDLDAHVDFNFHPVTKQHRRLNMIVYFNDQWDDNWGGSLDLHKDPHKHPRDDEIATVTPLMNRCVIFETTEWSWHGFTRINLPEELRENVSRKSFALYYYTDTRPREEMGKPHSTIYVERHLPQHIQSGMALGEDDFQHIQMLLARRDQHLQRLYGNIQNLEYQLDSAMANNVTPPMKSQSSETQAETVDQDDDKEQMEQLITLLQNQLYQIRNSSSWRITAPLRKARYFAAKVVRTWIK